MPITQDFLDELHDRLPVEELIGSYVELKKRGRLFVGLCPFHNEKTPSFTVYPDSKSYYCFGCGAGGDIITFVRKYENLEYIEALKFLADKAGMPMPDDTDNSEANKRKRILEANKLAARFFFNCLNSDEGRDARAYLRRRGLTDATITRFGLGYAPAGWSQLRDFLRSKGYTYEEMIEAGLCNEGRNGSCYDFFRERVMFPVIDVRGQVIAFSGRTMGSDSRKYLNTRDTPVFNKKKTLFSLNFAKNADTGRVILVEGQMDVISLYQAGFTDAVATLGTAITEEHARILTRYVSEVLISYDADEAGQKATKRAIDTLRSVEMPVKVIQIEGGKDPDELIKQYGAPAFQALIDKASGSMQYELSKAKRRYDLESAEGKVDYLKDAVRILGGITNATEREVWAGRVSEETGVEKSTILDSVKRAQRSARYAQQKKDEQKFARSVEERYNIRSYERQNLGSAAAERRLIALLCTHPDLEKKVRNRLNGSDFVSGESGAIFDALCKLIENGNFTGFSSAASALSPEQMAVFSGILAENNEVKFSVSDCDYYIDKILERGSKPSENDIRGMDAAQIQKLIEKKTGNTGEKNE